MQRTKFSKSNQPTLSSIIEVRFPFSRHVCLFEQARVVGLFFVRVVFLESLHALGMILWLTVLLSATVARLR